MRTQNSGWVASWRRARQSFYNFYKNEGECMSSRKLILAFVVLVVGAVHLGASGPLGIYGIVEKVVFEPNEQSPERIQVWGAFAYVDGGVGSSLTVSAPKRGYLYFRLGSSADSLV